MKDGKLNIDRMMNIMIIHVSYRYLLFFKKSSKIYILYTPQNEVIYKINTNMPNRKYPFIVADNINKAVEWADKKGFEYRKRKHQSNYHIF